MFSVHRLSASFGDTSVSNSPRRCTYWELVSRSLVWWASLFVLLTRKNIAQSRPLCCDTKQRRNLKKNHCSASFGLKWKENSFGCFCFFCQRKERNCQQNVNNRLWPLKYGTTFRIAFRWRYHRGIFTDANLWTGRKLVQSLRKKRLPRRPQTRSRAATRERKRSELPETTATKCRFESHRHVKRGIFSMDKVKPFSFVDLSLYQKSKETML